MSGATRSLPTRQQQRIGESGTHPPSLGRSRLERFLVLPYVVLRDSLSSDRPVTLSSRADVMQCAAEGISWLCRTHDVTGRRGCSKGFSLLTGWMAPFPETTGYIIGTLLDYSRLTDDASLVERARQMADWEIDVQNPDGGVIVGLLSSQPKPSTVFNTGMVMHGWLDLYELERDERYLESAVRGGRYLVRQQDDDGAWRGACEYRDVPHTYSARVSWALLRLADATGEDSFRLTARRQLDWVLSMQQANGWLDACAFVPSMDPNTHVIAYTLRGLIESAVLLDHDPYLDAARLTADVLLGRFRELGKLPGTYDRRWTPTAHYECVTGIAQLAGIWLRLHQLTGEPRFLDAGVDALGLAVARQSRVDWDPLHGAVPGSFPIYGRYAPLQYPNWATKFLVDSLLQRLELMDA
jgi:hypothetical protein